MHRIVIDTDPGVEDSVMIQLALWSPDVEIEAITTVFGNNTVNITARNALINLRKVAERTDIPVARGAARPLMRPYDDIGQRAKNAHGEDGLGNATQEDPELRKYIQDDPVWSQHATRIFDCFLELRRLVQQDQGLIDPPQGFPQAAELIVDRVMKKPGEITLLAVGPLTNLALAVSLEPAIAHLVKQVVIMGGAATVPGNASPVAEANIRNDPESARIVFHAGWPLTMVGLDVTTKTVMPKSALAQICQASTLVTNFLIAITPFYVRWHSQPQRNINGMHLHDTSALAYILDPTLFTTEKIYVDVETHGNRTSGQTVADFRKRFGEAPNVNVCLGVDSPRLLAMCGQRLTQ